MAGSVPFLAASAASVASGWLSQARGRRWSLAAGGLALLLGTALSCWGASRAMLLGGRCVAGLGLGFVGHATPIYLGSGLLEGAW